MRIDKYLWAVRLFKTRSIAIDAINGGKVKLNGDNIKPARDVKEGETFTVQTQSIQKTIKVLAFPVSRVGAKDVAAFMEDLTPEEEYRKIEGLKGSRFVFRPRGTGRPTKKERRDIEDWFEDDPAREH